MSMSAQTITIPQCAFDRLELARNLFREYHARCFWNSPRDLDITEEDVPFVVKGLRLYGGHTGFKLSGKLRPNASDRKTLECH
jgi:hypothetical protein